MLVQERIDGTPMERNAVGDECREQQVFLLGVMAPVGKLAHEGDRFPQQGHIHLPAGPDGPGQSLQTSYDLQNDFVLMGQHVDCGVGIHDASPWVRGWAAGWAAAMRSRLAAGRVASAKGNSLRSSKRTWPVGKGAERRTAVRAVERLAERSVIRLDPSGQRVSAGVTHRRQKIRFLNREVGRQAGVVLPADLVPEGGDGAGIAGCRRYARAFRQHQRAVVIVREVAQLRRSFHCASSTVPSACGAPSAAAAWNST
jgi:hypothetical protein